MINTYDVKRNIKLYANLQVTICIVSHTMTCVQKAEILGMVK